jgi:anti-sigma-K factor RskA
MNTISLERLRELLDAYGAEPAHWPEHERSSAERLLASSETARQCLRAAVDLDRALDHWSVPAPPVALQARVLRQMTETRPGWRGVLKQIWEDLGGWRIAAPAFAFSLAMGAVLPVLLDDVDGDLPEEDLIAAVQFVDESPDFGP